jgi:hypothetical protein
MVLSLLLLYQLANRMYGKPVGGWTLAVLMVLSLPGIHPFWYGRQAISEAPCVFFILFGYWFLSKPEARSSTYLLTGFTWGLAMSARGVAIPFLSAALIFPAIVAGFRKNWGIIEKYALTWVSSLAVYLILSKLEHWLGQGLFEYGLMQGSESTWFFVTQPQVRLETLLSFTTIGLLSILGIGYAIRLNWRDVFSPAESQSAMSYVRISWFTLVSSWLVWYLLLSIGWLRHYLPAFYLSSIYQALLLLQAGTTLRSTESRPQRITYTVLGCLILLLFATLNAFSLVIQLQDRDDALLTAVNYLNAETAPDALVEAYAPEIFYYLEHEYHYPPDQIQLELNRRAYLHLDIEIDYAPLTADPDYIVIGPLERFWGLYTTVVTTDHFELVYENWEYEIYRQIGAMNGD